MAVCPFPATNREQIQYDLLQDILNVQHYDAELLEQTRELKPRVTDFVVTAFEKQAEAKALGVNVLVTHPGGAKEKHCYADK